MDKEEIKIKEEIMKVYGKREMLWRLQREIWFAKIRGKIINENLVLQILKELDNIQEIEEENWTMEKYIESELDQYIIQESKLLNMKLKGV